MSRLLSRVLVCGLATLALGGCERGCIWKWLDSAGVAADPGKPSHGSPLTHEVDCPDGLARCANGAIEVSQPFRHPDPCQGAPEKCSCPWTKGPACGKGCVADGVEVVIAPDQAVRQLCVGPEASLTFARPPSAPPPSPSACDGERYRCLGVTVVACAPPRAVATCSFGCVSEDLTLDDEDLTDEQAVSIVCRRSP